MTQIRILSASDIEKLFTLDMAIKAVENAYLQKSLKSGCVWPMVFHEFVHGESDLDIKSGDLQKEQVFGLKVVSWYGTNEQLGLPDLFGTSLLFDRRTGEPKALLNAGPITGLRTGAAGAIGAKILAKPSAKSLLMVGCGFQSAYLIAATLYLLPGINSVTVVNPHHPEKASDKLPLLIGKVKKLLSACHAECQCEWSAYLSVENAVKSSDIILTATPSYEPMIQAQWVQKGTHLSCIGSDMSGKQEIDPNILANALVFGDDKMQCLTVGECEKAYKTGIFNGAVTEIGDVLAKNAKGRTSPEEITVFDSTGIALQDLASAALVLEAAEQLGIGVLANL